MTDLSKYKKVFTSAGCFVLDRLSPDANLLLLYCEYEDGQKGWVLPKGIIEPGESKEHAAIRETAEETGYGNIKIVKELPVSEYEFKDQEGNLYFKRIYFYLATLTSEEKPKQKLESYETFIKKVDWLPLRSVKNKLLFGTEKPIIDEIFSYIESI